MRKYKNELYKNRKFTWNQPVDDDPSRSGKTYYTQQIDPPVNYDEEEDVEEDENEEKDFDFDEQDPEPKKKCDDPCHKPEHKCKPCDFPHDPDCCKHPMPPCFPCPMMCPPPCPPPCPPIPYPPMPYPPMQYPPMQYPPMQCPPMPYPMPYPMPCPPPCPHEHEMRPPEAFGYFASITPTGTFEEGSIPFTYADPINDNVELTSDPTQVTVRIPGVYRVVYSVTVTADAPGVTLQLYLNSVAVPNTEIPILEGVNVNEVFLFLKEKDTLALTHNGAITLAEGKNASLLLQRIA